MSERKEGYYWCRLGDEWAPLHTDDGSMMYVDEIGPRIPSPDEAPPIGTRYRNEAGEVMAVVVPAKATFEMREAGAHPKPIRGGHGHFQANMYLAMLDAIPDPSNT
ncbi:hypothetical protein MHM84_03415 [Halomonas sp. McH1-25]|uniref:hypothetical protein n=1 Tax=unclassified Halomonas TaxID=2609666 RepID=UPI001EF5885A|nr:MULTISPECIES: hypothetical protein [unclassified Halomonas]MCG7598820.1 hypothetical protein [Halomonas sp. McH1-25]MCP1340783.1 hypothetical protein [Halomonas sp. FL8]MCP1362206.1 hypothetical protein [Halomonas sp. BBD45]